MYCNVMVCEGGKACTFKTPPLRTKRYNKTLFGEKTSSFMHSRCGHIAVGAAVGRRVLVALLGQLTTFKRFEAFVDLRRRRRYCLCLENLHTHHCHHELSKHSMCVHVNEKPCTYHDSECVCTNSSVKNLEAGVWTLTYRGASEIECFRRRRCTHTHTHTTKSK